VTAEFSAFPDEELLQNIEAGAEEAFTALYRRYQGAIYRFALRMSGSESFAEDITQETFVVLLEGGNRYESETGTVSSYLYGIARNRVLRRLRRDKVYAADGIIGTNDPAGLSDPQGDLVRQEMIGRLRRAVLGLPLKYREVVVLCDLHELTYAGAAAVLRCSVGTVRSRLHRGRNLLVTRLHAAGLGDSLAKTSRCFA